MTGLLSIHPVGDDLMNANAQSLTPAAELARVDPVRFPNESPEYRVARTALLAKEIELRRHIERVAAEPERCRRAAR
jgi:hypothetical protein